MSTDGGISELARADDVTLLAELRAMWARRDPVPGDLADRICFALSLDDLEVELMQLAGELLRPSGARSEEQARTVTFTSDSLSVMVNISPIRGRSVRIDGWIDDGGGLDVELRLGNGSRRGRADEEGRFAFDGVLPGLMQLVFHPTQGANRILIRDVVTPAVQV